MMSESLCGLVRIFAHSHEVEQFIRPCLFRPFGSVVKNTVLKKYLASY